MKKAILAAILFLLASPLEAATRWVTTTGIGTGDCLTTGTACTRDRALTVAVAGDEIVFRDGTYSSWTQWSITTGGTSDTVRLTIRAENRHQAIITGGVSTLDFRVRRSWITVRGFKFDGANDNDIPIDVCDAVTTCGGNGNVLQGIIIEDNWLTNIGGRGIRVLGANDVILRYNQINSTGNRAAECCSESIYISSATITHAVNNIQVYGNTMTNVISNVWDVKSNTTNANIHHNLVDGWSWPGVNQIQNDPGAGVFAGGGQTSTGSLFRNNILRNGTQAGVGLYAVLRTQEANWSVNNNVIHDFQGSRSMSIRDTTGTNQDWTSNTWCNTPSTIEENPDGTVADTTGNLFDQVQGVCDAEVTRITGELAARPIIASAEIGLIAADKIRVTWTNDKFPPLASVDNAKITCTVAGVARTVNSSSIIGTNITEHTLASAVTAGQAVVCAGTLGLVVNSGRVGATWISDLADSAALTTGAGGVPSITNNVDGAPETHNFANSVFQFYGIRKVSDSVVRIPHTAVAVSTNVSVVPGANLILAVQVDCTSADCPPIGVVPYYQKNGAGGYAALTGSFGADNVRIGTSQAGIDVPNEGEVIATCLSGALTPANGLMVMTANAIPTVDLVQNGCVTNRWAIEFNTTVTAGDYYDFRAYDQTGAALNTYTVTPRVTIIGDRAGGAS